MSNQRTSAYVTIGEKGPGSYKPIANTGLVVDLGTDLAPEYRAILPFDQDREMGEGGRLFSILSDTVLEHHGHYAELVGDTRFVLNALLASRAAQATKELVAFGNGFRGDRKMQEHTSTYLSRAIQALDCFALETSGDILVNRTGWGSGSKPKYGIMPDINMLDERFSQR